MRRTLRIVVPRYGAEVTGGSESYSRSLAHELTHRGWNVEVWTTTALLESTWAEHFKPGQSKDGEVTVHRFSLSAARNPEMFHQFSRAFFRMPRALRPEEQWIRMQGPAAARLVHALGAATPRPTLFTPYLYYPYLKGVLHAPRPRILLAAAHDEKPLRLRAVEKALRHTDALWFHTPEEQTLLNAVFPFTKSKPQATGTIGVPDPPENGAAAFALKAGIGRYLLYFGRVTEGKGVEPLLIYFQALRRIHPDVSLVMLGAGTERFQDIDGVHPFGFVSDAEKWSAIRGAAAVVLPSEMESLSIAALEAWICGTPTLANRHSVVLAGQTQRSGGGLLYDSESAFVSGAKNLLEDTERAKEMGESGREFVQANYQWDTVAERLQQLIAEASPQ